MVSPGSYWGERPCQVYVIMLQDAVAEWGRRHPGGGQTPPAPLNLTLPEVLDLSGCGAVRYFSDNAYRPLTEDQVPIGASSSSRDQFNWRTRLTRRTALNPLLPQPGSTGRTLAGLSSARRATACSCSRIFLALACCNQSFAYF